MTNHVRSPSGVHFERGLCGQLPIDLSSERSVPGCATPSYHDQLPRRNLQLLSVHPRNGGSQRVVFYLLRPTFHRTILQLSPRLDGVWMDGSVLIYRHHRECFLIFPQDPTTGPWYRRFALVGCQSAHAIGGVGPFVDLSHEPVLAAHHALLVCAGVNALPPFHGAIVRSSQHSR